MSGEAPINVGVLPLSRSGSQLVAGRAKEVGMRVTLQAAWGVALVGGFLTACGSSDPVRSPVDRSPDSPSGAGGAAAPGDGNGPGGAVGGAGSGGAPAT